MNLNKNVNEQELRSIGELYIKIVEQQAIAKSERNFLESMIWANYMDTFNDYLYRHLESEENLQKCQEAREKLRKLSRECRTDHIRLNDDRTVRTPTREKLEGRVEELSDLRIEIEELRKETDFNLELNEELPDGSKPVKGEK